MRRNGCCPLEITIAGGATRSPLWLQIHSDVCGLPLRVTEEKEAPSLGCAILAAVASGMYPNIKEAVESMVHLQTKVKPRLDVYMKYRPVYAQYLKLYHCLKPLQDEARPGVDSGVLAAQLKTLVAPSLLSAGKGDAMLDGAEAAVKAGAKWLHVDIMNKVLSLLHVPSVVFHV